MQIEVDIGYITFMVKAQHTGFLGTVQDSDQRGCTYNTYVSKLYRGVYYTSPLLSNIYIYTDVNSSVCCNPIRKLNIPSAY